MLLNELYLYLIFCFYQDFPRKSQENAVEIDLIQNVRFRFQLDSQNRARLSQGLQEKLLPY